MQRLFSLSALLPRWGRSFSSASTDYAVALKKAAELDTENGLLPKEAGFTAGIPMGTFTRKARIYSPARTASQSGLARTIVYASSTPTWKIEFDTLSKWENPLMGWTSTADPLENVGRTSLAFYTKEEAQRFCDKHGWTWEVEDPNPRRQARQKRYAQYGDNYGTRRGGIPDLSTLKSNRPPAK
ncbi:NADH dehydrogenase [ubiquinone] iron-sulfur protein 4, mitochondrial [Tetrabaena socialis]|uniref:NADH dehydrogenase [ubiquinone] iron-sulfur protein 4, mitochondrial n=1 Tax=Tetrabaena socialis TaxID=47790 RepID=A0A2J8ADW5_9CHLO|nr:NADH dehydrogenase [ubiquinone] iron-sulfur protein 4, mitochondrial [Tetrabaena socialis]|eukprot:PNH10704.1 NADH dehydrogenase [ubiquinone] iron-sulfur protein 4, mitochondrial [Tetrabaena socialis]